MNRKDFLALTGTLLAGQLIAPARAAAAGDAIAVGLIGVGNRGTRHLKTMLSQPADARGGVSTARHHPQGIAGLGSIPTKQPSWMAASRGCAFS